MAHEIGEGVGMTGMLKEVANSTAGILVGAAMESTKAKLSGWTSLAPTDGGNITAAEVGVGLGWLRSLLGKSEWTLPCVNVKIRL